MDCWKSADPEGAFSWLIALRQGLHENFNVKLKRKQSTDFVNIYLVNKGVTVQFIYLFIIYTDCKGEKKRIHKKRLMCTNYYQSSMNFSVKCFIFPYLFCVVVSVSLQARHPVHPGLSLPSKTRQVSRRPVVATVVGP